MRRKNRLVTIILTALTAILSIGIAVSLVQKKQPNPPAPSAPRETAAGENDAARNRGGGAGSPAAQNAIPVRVTPITLGAIESSIVINGDVLAGKEVSIYPSVAGKLVSMRFKPGETVVQRQVLAMVDPSRPGEVYEQNPVVSTITGTVLSALANTGDTVSTNTAVYIVGDVSNVVVESFVPERFSTAIHEGLAASISFEAIHDEFFAATVNEVSPALDPSSRTMRIRLHFAKKDARIKPGMFAQASLVTEARYDALVVPRNSVINTYGSFIVFIVDEKNTARQVEIGIGLESEAQIQVVSGLKEGDRVVFEGQNFLTDGDAVRIVE